MKKYNNGLPYIIIGTIFFISRYIPFYHYDIGILSKIGIMNTWFSIDRATVICKTMFGSFVEQCNWVVPANITLIIVAICLVAYGIYLNYKNKGDNNDGTK